MKRVDLAPVVSINANTEIISILETLLRDARSGELRALVTVGVFKYSIVSYGFTRGDMPISHLLYRVQCVNKDIIEHEDEDDAI